MENKWWEYYAVRYFVGTVIGALIISFLNVDTCSPYVGKLTLGDNAKEVSFLGVGLVAALGFAFCYVASAPVLILHAFRAHIRVSTLKRKWASTAFLFIFLLSIGWFLLQKLFPPYIAAVASLIVGLQIMLIVLALYTNFSVIELFYRELATARSAVLAKKDQPVTAGGEYVTSYRHLREHGNAFAIVVLEGVLGATLYYVPSIKYAICFVGIWLLPATFAWVLGSVLESRFTSNRFPPP